MLQLSAGETVSGAQIQVIGVRQNDLDAGGAQDRGIQRVDRTLAVQLGEAASLEGAVAVAQQHHRPVGTIGVLLIGVVAGVHNQGVVHHCAATLGHTLQRLHDSHEHTAVVLPDFDPDRIVGLLHVSEVVPLLLDAQSLPGAEDLSAT